MENKIKSIIIATLLLIMPSISFAGIVKGKIIEQGTNEPLTGATIVANDGQGTSADIDGNYSLKLKNGTYTLTVRFIGFKTMIKENVKVTGDELIIDFVLEPNNTTLGEVTVSSTLRHNTDASATREQAYQADTGQGCRRGDTTHTWREHHRREVRDGARTLTTI